MSVQSTTSTDECKQCDAKLDDFYAPGYCSETCYYRQQGDTKLNLLRHDHRLCANCGRWLKEVHKPPEGWIEDCHSIVEHALDHGGEIRSEAGQLVLDITDCPTTRRTAADSVVGYQTRTKNSRIVEKEFTKESFQRTFRMGTGCVCGSTDTRTTDDTLQGLEMATVLANYVYRFRELEREGQHSDRIDKDAFFNAYQNTADMQYALGKAFA